MSGKGGETNSFCFRAFTFGDDRFCFRKSKIAGRFSPTLSKTGPANDCSRASDVRHTLVSIASFTLRRKMPAGRFKVIAREINLRSQLRVINVFVRFDGIIIAFC